MAKRSNRKRTLEGRCNAETDGGFCHARPAKGTTRCRIHGGQKQAWAQRLHGVDERGRAEVAAALEDPDLLDVRRPIALGEAILGRTPLLPSDAMVEQLARRRILAMFSPGQLEALADHPDGMALLSPNAADLEAARLELHERSIRIVATHSKRQVEAVKHLEWSKVIRETALPLFGEIGLRISRILRKYVPEDKLAAAIEEVRREIRQTIGELALLRDVKT